MEGDIHWDSNMDVKRSGPRHVAFHFLFHFFKINLPITFTSRLLIIFLLPYVFPSFIGTFSFLDTIILQFRAYLL